MTEVVCHRNGLHFQRAQIGYSVGNNTEKVDQVYDEQALSRKWFTLSGLFVQKNQTLLPPEVDISMTSDFCHRIVRLFPAQVGYSAGKKQRKGRQFR